VLFPFQLAAFAWKESAISRGEKNRLRANLAQSSTQLQEQ